MPGMLNARPAVTTLPGSFSEQADRATLPEGLQNGVIVYRTLGFWTVRDFFGTEWDVTFNLAGDAFGEMTSGPSIALGEGMDPEDVVTDFTRD